jgi:hypothetical protein
MTDEQRGYLQALDDVRAWHLWQIEQKLEDLRGREGHEATVVWLDLLIAAKMEHAAEDGTARQQERTANSQTGAPKFDPASSGSRTSGRP